MHINETGTHLHTMHKNKPKWFKDLNLRQGTIKLLEENTGKTLSDINLTKLLLGQSAKATEIKAKIIVDFYYTISQVVLLLMQTY